MEGLGDFFVFLAIMVAIVLVAIAVMTAQPAFRWLSATLARRFFFILMVTAIAIANAYVAQAPHFFDPTRWYFWTTDRTNRYGDKLNVEQTIRPVPGHRVELEEYLRRCGYDLRGLLVSKSVNVATEYRGVTLCNAGDHSGEEWDRRVAFFKTAVDEEYGRHYSEVAGRHFTATASAISIWLGCLGIYAIGLWVIKGTDKGNRATCAVARGAN